MLEKITTWARRIKRDVVALWLAARDRSVPLTARLLAAVIAAYALSPIDLIPDFISLLGYVDDLLIVPLGISVAVHLIPARLMVELRAEAEGRSRPVSRAGLVFVVALWIGAAALSAWFFRLGVRPVITR